MRDGHLRTLGVEPVSLVDVWHALEYVANAARFLVARERRMPGTFRRRRKMLLEEPGGVTKIVNALRAAGLHEARDESGRRPVCDAMRYLDSRVARMDYAGAKARGIPIGSGTVEATATARCACTNKNAAATLDALEVLLDDDRAHAEVTEQLDLDAVRGAITGPVRVGFKVPRFVAQRI